MRQTHKFMDGEQVRFGQWIIDVENLGEVVHSPMGVFESKSSLVLEASRRIDPNRDACTIVFTLCHGLNIFKVTDSPRKQLEGGD